MQHAVQHGRSDSGQLLGAANRLILHTVELNNSYDIVCRMKCTHVQGGGGGGLYDRDAHVVSLVSGSFPTRTDHSVYLVEFYAPWYVLPATL